MEMNEEKYLLRKDDLEAMSELITSGYDNIEYRKKYSKILYTMAQSMLSDDAIVVTEDYFEREHGI